MTAGAGSGVRWLTRSVRRRWSRRADRPSCASGDARRPMPPAPPTRAGRRRGGGGGRRRDGQQRRVGRRRLERRRSACCRSARSITSRGMPASRWISRRAVGHGRRRATSSRVDVGEVNGRTFVNNSSIGVYPDIVVERERLRQQGYRKWTGLRRGERAHSPPLSRPGRAARRRRARVGAHAHARRFSSSATTSTRSTA